MKALEIWPGRSIVKEDGNRSGGKPISRRDFLKFTAVGLGVLYTPAVVRNGIARLADRDPNDPRNQLLLDNAASWKRKTWVGAFQEGFPMEPMVSSTKIEILDGDSSLPGIQLVPSSATQARAQMDGQWYHCTFTAGHAFSQAERYFSHKTPTILYNRTGSLPTNGVGELRWREYGVSWRYPNGYGDFPPEDLGVIVTPERIARERLGHLFPADKLSDTSTFSYSTGKNDTFSSISFPKITRPDLTASIARANPDEPWNQWYRKRLFLDNLVTASGGSGAGVWVNNPDGTAALHGLVTQVADSQRLSPQDEARYANNAYVSPFEAYGARGIQAYIGRAIENFKSKQ